MDQFFVKFRLIIIPFLIIAIATTGIYSFLRWWFFIKNEVFVIDEPIVNFAGPLVLSLIAVLIWMRPRLKQLDFDSKNLRHPAIGATLLVWIAISVPSFFAQQYLISATGKLTQLTSISEISTHPKTKYYTLKNVYIDKQQARPYTITATSGKHNRNYDMAIYMPCPIFAAKDTQSVAGNIKPLVWLAIKYKRTIRNNLTAADKDRAFNLFCQESKDDFDNRDFTNFTFLDRIGPSRELRKYADAITFKGSYKTPYIILLPKWGRFEDRNGNMLLWFVGSLAIGTLIFILIIAVFPLKEQVKINDWYTPIKG
jgi:rhomboid protease GluP